SFFFQAEDGIRDATVTGVQTCALPIYLLVVLGWLFTPVLAWGASYAGLWLGAVVAARLSRPLVMLGVAALGAAIFGFAALAMWRSEERRVGKEVGLWGGRRVW